MVKEATAAPKRFRPISLGIMFFTLGLAMKKAGEFSPLNYANTIIMWVSLVISILLLVAFFLYLNNRVKKYLDQKARGWIYYVCAIYLFAFIINWLLSLAGASTDLVFHFVFWLGFLWFTLLAIILCTGLHSNIKYMASGMMFGSGIPSLYSQNYVALLCLWVFGIVIYFAARKDLDWTEYFPV